MFNKNDMVIYKGDVCKIIDIKNNSFSNKMCYMLVPLYDESLTISVPVENENGYLKNILSKKEVLDLIRKIPKIKVLDVDSKLIENEYKNLFRSGNHEDLIKIIKTTYLRNKKRIECKRSIGEKDKEYFDKAERKLYGEFSIVLGMSVDDVRKFIVKTVQDNIQ